MWRRQIKLQFSEKREKMPGLATISAQKKATERERTEEEKSSHRRRDEVVEERERMLKETDNKDKTEEGQMSGELR